MSKTEADAALAAVLTIIDAKNDGAQAAPDYNCPVLIKRVFPLVVAKIMTSYVEIYDRYYYDFAVLVDEGADKQSVRKSLEKTFNLSGGHAIDTGFRAVYMLYHANENNIEAVRVFKDYTQDEVNFALVSSVLNPDDTTAFDLVYNTYRYSVEVDRRAIKVAAAKHANTKVLAQLCTKHDNYILEEGMRELYETKNINGFRKVALLCEKATDAQCELAAKVDDVESFEHLVILRAKRNDDEFSSFYVGGFSPYFGTNIVKQCLPKVYNKDHEFKLYYVLEMHNIDAIWEILKGSIDGKWKIDAFHRTSSLHIAIGRILRVTKWGRANVLEYLFDRYNCRGLNILYERFMQSDIAAESQKTAIRLIQNITITHEFAVSMLFDHLRFSPTIAGIKFDEKQDKMAAVCDENNAHHLMYMPMFISPIIFRHVFVNCLTSIQRGFESWNQVCILMANMAREWR